MVPAPPTRPQPLPNHTPSYHRPFSPQTTPFTLCLFTDTLGDVNGVSRFIRNMTEQALGSPLTLHAMTSSRFTCPDLPTIHNLTPLAATRMPRYPQLDLVLPPFSRLLQLTRTLKPDLIHLSTPGPVGLAGALIARRLRIPTLGTYHTDFPAFVQHLFDDDALAHLTSLTMRRFYKPMSRVLTRSPVYIQNLLDLGISPTRIITLSPGIDTNTFHARHRDPAIWTPFPLIRPGSFKVLYVGRVSIEKNLPLITHAWPRALHRCRQLNIDAQLIVIGDGPYRAHMNRILTEQQAPAVFLGFRHGRELSTLYASADILLFPSTTDTLGQVVLEAQSSGLVPLVSSVGGPATIVRHGDTGLILSPTQPEPWADAIAQLAADPERRRAMAHAAHASAQQLPITATFDHFRSIHADALAEHRATQPQPPS